MCSSLMSAELRGDGVHQLNGVTNGSVVSKAARGANTCLGLWAAENNS